MAVHFYSLFVLTWALSLILFHSVIWIEANGSDGKQIIIKLKLIIIKIIIYNERVKGITQKAVKKAFTVHRVYTHNITERERNVMQFVFKFLMEMHNLWKFNNVFLWVSARLNEFSWTRNKLIYTSANTGSMYDKVSSRAINGLDVIQHIIAYVCVVN